MTLRLQSQGFLFMNDYIITEYVTVKPGMAYRLLPFGVIHKNGKRRVVTPELAQRFKLPHFKPPIKLGSHDDATPAGGHMVSLEVRADGLWVVPEYTEKGLAAVMDGNYRYHSPEIMWEGWIEHPETGEKIEAPLIVGDALLHTPHLGEATALYTYQPEVQAMSEMVQIPVSFWDKLTAVLFPPKEERQEQPTPQQTPQTQPDNTVQLTAIQKERDDYAAKVASYQAEIETLKAQQAKQTRVEKFGSELKETIFNGDTDLYTLLAELPEEKANALLTKFKALASQVNLAAVTKAVGATGDPDTTKEETLNDVIIKYTVEHKVDYATAFNAIKASNPELVARHLKGVK